MALTFVLAIWKDADREWKKYQKEYNQKDRAKLEEAIQVARAQGDKTSIADIKKEMRAIGKRKIEIKQILTPELEALGMKRVDRCITCHVGYDATVNPAMVNEHKGHPYAAPKNRIHELHPFERYGCAVCHGGQGLATKVLAAHPKGVREDFWEKPFLKGAAIQASCLKCHEDFNRPDLFKEKPEAWKVMKEATAVVARGRGLFVESGCIACHAIRGNGGTLSEDLGEIADKPFPRIDFSYTGLPEHEWTVANWVKVHFTQDPAKNVPGDPLGEKFGMGPVSPSGMPYFEFTGEEVEALTTYLLSLTSEKIPKDYYRFAGPEPEPKFKRSIDRGAYVYVKYGCVACHGASGQKGVRNFNAQSATGDMNAGRVPDLVKTVATFTREELRGKIDEGVNPEAKENPAGPSTALYMPAWKDKIKGEEMEALLDYLFSIAEKTESWDD